MAKKYSPSVPYEDCLIESLQDPAEAAAYIEAALEEDVEVFLIALRHVAKARGMAKVAKQAKLGRESLYKVLSEAGNPELRTVNKLLHAMGLRMSVQPAKAA